ncbi:MAG: DUF1992 domain-containing protein [Actinobacteria bacterium]|nr:DUF1992 domain-containing protein [Actinomycetota bacterium]
MDWMDKLAEQRIMQAESEGALDNLPGKGRPLPPDPFFRMPEQIRLAARVLTMCGCAPQELGLLRNLNEARHLLNEAGTAEEKAQRMREYCDAELRYNIAMDRHREMFAGRIPRATQNRAQTSSPW